MYLKVMTWTEPGIDGNAIYGTLQDLRRLAGIIEANFRIPEPAPVLRIQEEFAAGCEYSLVLGIRDDDFDPASADPELSKGAG
jgi:hypothetical protein